MAFLNIVNLKKRFGNVEILKGINLELEQGGFMVLVGPSGCGKSTLLNTIAGLESISEGDIQVDGSSIASLLPSQRDIAMVFQSYALYPNMTVAGNIAFGMEMRGVPKAERDKAVETVSKTLQIGHLLERKPSQLSGGQRQRVAMGRALVRDPKLFLFDEPLSNLDAKLRVDMRIEIKRLHASTGKTIVYVTHDQIEAMTLATRIAVMRDGEVQQFGTPAQIYNKPANIFVADFMGSPAMNLIKAKVAHENGVPVLKLAKDAGGEMSLRVPETIADTRLEAGREVIFGIRPEAITDRDGADRNSRAIELVEAQVEVVEPAGSDTFVVSHLGGKEVTARMRSDVDVRPGQILPFAFNLDKAVVFDPQTQKRL
jgi:multiple sugar transport system ATP-binding protein